MTARPTLLERVLPQVPFHQWNLASFRGSELHDDEVTLVLAELE